MVINKAHPICIFPLLLLGLSATPIVAQPLGEDTPERFQIEIVVFARTGADPSASWHVNQPLPDIQNLRELNISPPKSAEDPIVVLEPAEDFSTVEPQQWALLGVEDRLNQSGRFRVIYHTAWVQPETPFENPVAVRIATGDMLQSTNTVQTPSSLVFTDAWGAQQQPDTLETRSDEPTQLMGSAAFSKGQFLHLALDLAWHTPVPDDQRFQGLMPQDGNMDMDDVYYRYRLTERRRIRTGELMYFDHARFGVVALVTRIDGENAVH